MSSTASPWRELARTTGDGVTAALLWNESSNRVKVAVSDERICHHVEFQLVGADALSTFRRPFADVVTQLTREARANEGANA